MLLIHGRTAGSLDDGSNYTAGMDDGVVHIEEGRGMVYLKPECTEMCSSHERERRERESDLNILERAHPRIPVPMAAMAVKKFQVRLASCVKYFTDSLNSDHLLTTRLTYRLRSVAPACCA